MRSYRERRGKSRKREYIEAAQAAMKSGEELEYDSYIQQMYEDWNEQFTSPEKYGYSADNPGPITFAQFLLESYDTLKWRMNKDLPDKRANNEITRQEFEWNMHLVQLMIEFNKRKLSELGVSESAISSRKDL